MLITAMCPSMLYPIIRKSPKYSPKAKHQKQARRMVAKYLMCDGACLKGLRFLIGNQPQPAPHKGVFRSKLKSTDCGAKSMAFNQIQFQHGMSITEFLGCFGTEAQCAEAVKQARWPDGFRCPRCGVADHYVVGHGARKLFQCNGCRHQTSLTAGSLMEHTKLPLTTWFLAGYLISQAKPRRGCRRWRSSVNWA